MITSLSTSSDSQASDQSPTEVSEIPFAQNRNLIQEEQAAVNQEKDEPPMIYVHLCGAVMNPGVYEVSESSRVFDVIEQAGGLSQEAAGDYINQAQQVKDGQRIYIPTKDEVEGMSPVVELSTDDQNPSSTTDKKLININLADAKELMELPGVGEAKAASIIEYRNANGSFQTIEELMKIPGIKEGLFNKVSSYITVK